MSDAAPSSVSEMLASWKETDRESFRKLVPLLYEDLRRVAHQRLRKTRPDHTLQTTALVHEVYLRLVEAKNVDWQNRAHVSAGELKIVLSSDFRCAFAMGSFSAVRPSPVTQVTGFPTRT